MLAWVQAEKFEGRIIINPGSATGAYSSMTEAAPASFVLMDIDGDKVRQLMAACTFISI